MRSTTRVLGVLALLVAITTAAAPGVVRIRPGDTLSEIAHRYGISVSALKHANHLRGDTIYAGELLRVPGTAAPQQAPAPARTVVASYVVRSGDNLTLLAKRWHTTVNELAHRNHLRRTTIVIGQRLTYATTRAAAPAKTPVVASAALHRKVLKARPVPSKSAARTMIRKSATRHGVPASLALALAYQESGFQQRVVSGVDAIGVMQVLPSTGRALERLHGRRFDLLQASDNIEAGVLLLHDLLRATGSVDGALAGYYQGLGSVRAKGLLPQTQQYIKNVKVLRSRFA